MSTKICGKYSGPYHEDYRYICTLEPGHDGDHYNFAMKASFKQTWPFDGPREDEPEPEARPLVRAVPHTRNQSDVAARTGWEAIKQVCDELRSEFGEGEVSIHWCRASRAGDEGAEESLWSVGVGYLEG